MTAAVRRQAAIPLAAAVTAIGLFIWTILLLPFPTGAAGQARYEPTGAWLSDLVIHFFDILALPWPRGVVLAVFSSLVMGAFLAWLYRRLVYNDWHPAAALIFVGAVGANALVVSAVVRNHQVIPLMVAVAALVPGIRRLESVGDVQAEMSFGLVLPLLFLAGPATAALIPVLAVFGARSDGEARRDGRAYFAMLLVAILPTLFVMAGLFGVFGPKGAASVFDSVYTSAFASRAPTGEDVDAVLGVVGYGILPYAILLGAYLLSPDRRWQPWSAVAVFALPLYLAIGSAVFSWSIGPSTAAAVFLAAFASWLSVARLTPILRTASLALVILGAGVSWIVPVLTGEASWLVHPPELRGTLAF